MTKKYKRLYLIFKLISICLTIVPLIISIIQGFKNGSMNNRFTLGCTIVIFMLLFSINIFSKFHLRSPYFIILLGLYKTIGDLQSLLIIMTICTALDEFIAVPLKNHFRDCYKINKEIDKRL